MTPTTSAPAETPLNLVPGELHDRRASMDIVRRQRRITQRDEERAHLAWRERIAGFDRGLTRDGRGELLVLCVRARFAIPRERRERLAKTPFRIEARMRHRDRAHDQRMSAKAFDLEAESLERRAVPLERIGLGRPEVKRHRKQEPLRRVFPALERLHELLVQHPLVG